MSYMGSVNDSRSEPDVPDFVPPVFKVTDSYEVLEMIGEGAYGTVCSANHKPSQTKVAIKRILPFDHPMYSQRTLREIRLLKHFRHENIIAILDIIPPPPYEEFTEVYLVQELMETDLHRVIRTQTLSDDHCQYFLYQLVRGLKALHAANVLHRDLKPSNLLLNSNCDLKICDFGLARSALPPTYLESKSDNAGFMTEYVATRWYRAPEVMLSFQAYTKAIDIWSVGTILVEMITCRPIFPGEDYHKQLQLILDVLGTPTMDDFNEITSEKSRDYIRTLPFTRRKRFESILPDANPLAVDFIKRCLTFSPSKRMTVEEALAHPYLASYHDPEDEPGAAQVPPDTFNFDLSDDPEGKDVVRIRRYTETLKRLLYYEIHQPMFQS